MKACRCGSLLTSASGLSSLLVRGRVLRNEIHRELRAKIAFWKTRVVSARESLRLSALIFEPRAGGAGISHARVATGADGDVERELSSRGPPDRCTVPGSFYVFIVTFSRTVASMYALLRTRIRVVEYTSRHVVPRRAPAPLVRGGDPLPPRASTPRPWERASFRSPALRHSSDGRERHSCTYSPPAE